MELSSATVEIKLNSYPALHAQYPILKALQPMRVAPGIHAAAESHGRHAGARDVPVLYVLSGHGVHTPSIMVLPMRSPHLL